MLSSTVAGRMRRIEDHVDAILRVDLPLPASVEMPRQLRSRLALLVIVLVAAAALVAATRWWTAPPTSPVRVPTRPRMAPPPSGYVARVPVPFEDVARPLRRSRRRMSVSPRAVGGSPAVPTAMRAEELIGGAPSGDLPAASGAAAAPEPAGSVPSPSAPSSVDRKPIVPETPAAAIEVEATRERRTERRHGFDAMRLLRNQ